jgi:hypothetical protein
MERLSPEEFKKRNDAIRKGRNKDRDYVAYVSDAVRRMKGKPKDQYMKHSAAIFRMEA